MHNIIVNNRIDCHNCDNQALLYNCFNDGVSRGMHLNFHQQKIKIIIWHSILFRQFQKWYTIYQHTHKTDMVFNSFQITKQNRFLLNNALSHRLKYNNKVQSTPHNIPLWYTRYIYMLNIHRKFSNTFRSHIVKSAFLERPRSKQRFRIFEWNLQTFNDSLWQSSIVKKNTMRTTQRRQASTASGMRRPFVGRSDATGQQKYLNIIIMRYSLLARRRRNPIIRGAPYVFHSPSVMTREQ